MLSTWLKTLEYVRLVRGYPHVSPTSFVAAQGGHQSDMFRLKWAEENSAAISLPDFHLAFLMSPLFRIELFLLSTLQGSTWKETTRLSHLKAVAKGQQASVGPWTTIMNDGDTNATFSSTSPTGVAVTRIMQCRVQDKSFCDTWWAIEKSDEGDVELVFGTDIRRYTKVARALDPLHNFYSRLLLASAAAQLFNHIKTE